MTQQNRLGLLLSIAALLGIAAATLTPLPLYEARAAETPFWCLVCGSLGSVDVILNVALFAPLGIGLRLLGWPIARIALVCFLASGTVEALQAMPIAGRDASLSDLLTNTIGGLAGGFLAHSWRAFVFATPRRAYLLFAAWTGVVLAVFAATAAMLQPNLPAGTWYGIVAPAWPGHGVFGGTVLQARLGNRMVPRDTLPRSLEYRREILMGAPLLARFVTTDEMPDGVAPIVMLASAKHESLILLSQRDHDVLFDLRLRASAWRLRAPRIRLGNAIPAASGQTVIAWGRFDGRQLYAGAMSNGRWQSRRLSLSIGLGWALLWPLERGLGPEVLAINALWLLALLGPLAYWAVLTKKRSSLIVLGTLVITILVVAPRVFGLEATHWSEWLAGVAAVAVGVIMGNNVGKRSPLSSHPWPCRSAGASSSS